MVSALDHFTVGSNGNILVVGDIDTGATGARAVWYGAPDDLVLLYRDDQPLPGFEHLADAGILQMAKMSPNGDRVAFLTDDSDTTSIWTHYNGVTSRPNSATNHRYRQVGIANNGSLVVGQGITYPIGDQGDSFTIYSVAIGPPGYPLSGISEQNPIPGFPVSYRYSLAAAVNCEGPISYQATDTNGRYLALIGLVKQGYKSTLPDSMSVLYFNDGNGSGRIVAREDEEAVELPPGIGLWTTDSMKTRVLAGPA